MFVGSLSLDLLLGDVHSLKEKRSLVRPIVAELRRAFAVSAAETGHLDLHRRAEVREVFRSSKFGNIAGCIVRSGEIRRNTKARLLRDGVVVNDNLVIDSLRRFKDDVTEVREGYECGIGLGSFNDIQNEDVIETFELREKPRA